MAVKNIRYEDWRSKKMKNPKIREAVKNNWPKCPKCGSQNVEIIEVWDATISWSPGEIYFNEGSLNPGDPIRVEGNCYNCEHVWRMRGIVQAKKEWFREE